MVLRWRKKAGNPSRKVRNGLPWAPNEQIHETMGPTWGGYPSGLVHPNYVYIYIYI